MHALTAQGAAATGPVHAVTKTSAKHLIQELDGRPAIESLRETLSKTLQKDSRVAELLKNALLIGLRAARRRRRVPREAGARGWF